MAAAPLVAQATPGTIAGSSDALFSDPYLLFTVPASTAARVDAVYLSLVSTSVANSFVGEQYVLQIREPGQTVQAEIWSPLLDSGEAVLSLARAQLTWMIDGVGTDQSATVTFVVTGPSMNLTGTLAATLALPPMVLQASSTLTVVRTAATPSGDVQVSGSVTYTPNAGAVSSATVADVTPFLLSTTNS